MTEDERCILCGSGEVEDVEHFLVRCNEFQGEREELLERVGEVEGADVWVEAFCGAGDEQRTAMMLGKQVRGIGCSGGGKSGQPSDGRDIELVEEEEGTGFWVV